MDGVKGSLGDGAGLTSATPAAWGCRVGRPAVPGRSELCWVPLLACPAGLFPELALHVADRNELAS